MTRPRRGPRYWTVRTLLRGARALRAVAAKLDPPPRPAAWLEPPADLLDRGRVLRGPWPPPQAPMDPLAASAAARAAHPSAGYRRRVSGYAHDDPPAL